MAYTVEDATNILEENRRDCVPKISFNPANKTLKKIIQSFDIQRGTGDLGIESDFLMYIADKFTFTNMTKAVEADYELSRTIPFQMSSSWGDNLPTISTYFDSDFVDTYEEFEGITQKATKRLGW